MTPLEQELRQMISEDGPIPVDRYMALCLSHPRYGYYMNRDPFGMAGDFVTSPEISQVFGELVGVWCAQTWLQLGQPDPVHLVELGPGRGTLMSDLLRAARALPEFTSALRVHLVETSAAMRDRQAATLQDSGHTPQWHERFEDTPEAPMLLVANELFDALPVRQCEWHDGTWYERVVGIDGEGRLALGRAPFAAPPRRMPEGQSPSNGDVVEDAPLRDDLAHVIGQRVAAVPGSGLVIDYGYEHNGFGDTLQAVRRHAFADVCEAPGECDLTAHVNFTALAQALSSAGAEVCQIMEQGDFLRALGVDARAAALVRSAGETEGAQISETIARLIHCDQMGTLFKVCGFSSPGIGPLYPFASPEP